MKIQRSVSAFVTSLVFLANYAVAQISIPPTDIRSEMEGNIIVAKLMDGDSLFPKITQIAQKHSLSSGVILFNIGQLRDFAIGQYNPSSKRFVSQTYKLPFELVSMQGTFGYTTDKFGGLQINCQATLADSTNATVAGHLSKGIVSITNEIVILKLKEINLIKAYNVKNGFWELDL